MPGRRASGLGLGPHIEAVVVSCEQDLLGAVTVLFRRFDPDIVVGWDVQGGSVGYLLQRSAILDAAAARSSDAAAAANPSFSTNNSSGSSGSGGALLRLLSRAPRLDADPRNGRDSYGDDHASGLWLWGRTVLNLWRVLRSELKLQSYAQPAVAARVLRRRLAAYPHAALAEWYTGPARGAVLSHVLERARVNLDLLGRLGLVQRTAEMARLFGISFFDVLRCVTSANARVFFCMYCHRKTLLSFFWRQVARQAAMECIPLVMEPRSKFYADPVVVLDFQSLYPSMVIAYNLCFSTIMGRLDLSDAGHTTTDRAGVDPAGTSPPSSEGTSEGGPYVSPNGAVFCSTDQRVGVLPRMLRELLETRIMVKGAMKRARDRGERVLERTLDARQFALKMISNVTYGYTAAGYSGRMPMAELADAIVECGRATLEAAIRMVESHPPWGARVVYGDTDSLFVLLEGRSTEEAFRVGKEIAAAVTRSNPPAVVLKLEKVYTSSLLVSKKRYVGHSIEDPRPPYNPRLDAKGIELVRRDQCPFVNKMQEKCIRVLFTTRDLSAVKAYCIRQWTRALAGRAGIQDFIFQKEVKLGTYASETYMPLAAIVATKRMVRDPASKPKRGERVPYVVVHGPPGARLMDLVVGPEALVGEGAQGGAGVPRVNAQYYISKVALPALDRLLSLAGVDVKRWYAEMPRPRHRSMSAFIAVGLASTAAVLQPQVALSRLAAAERAQAHTAALCAHCTGHPTQGLRCQALDCAVLFERREADIEATAARELCCDLKLM
ncbi:DNA polymerase zeta [Tribonema minus]|uniref:DNA polymerase n=1 Tax=Tribonema minus TaxID=303371 RepID=A0A835YMN6_9STRA|nr:DNA polymerase zeta [Tribonema minus]